MTVHPAQSSHQKYRPDIDGLRAIAVLSVVAFHAFPNWIRGGFIGVDIFFVISGYLISTIIFDNLDKGIFSFTEFYARRVKRIFPALILVLFSCFAIGWFILLPDEFKQLAKHIVASTGFISNFLLWNESGYFNNSAQTLPLLHLWSLSIEEQFYIIWPLLLWFTWKRRFNFLIIVILICLISFFLNIEGIKKDPIATFYSPQTRSWELMCGSLLAWFTLYKKNTYKNIENKLDKILIFSAHNNKIENDGKKIANALSLTGLFLLVYGFCQINKESNFPGKLALFPVLGSVLIILAGNKAWFNSKILSNKLAVWFGLISFPLYLWHWPLLAFATIVQSDILTINVRAVLIILSLILSWLTYKLIELPMRASKYCKAKTLALILLLIVTGFWGIYTHKNNGFVSRFPKAIQNLTNVKYNTKLEYREGSCFLKPEQSFEDFTGCEKRVSEKKHTILLWGDSHAAQLYPGLKKRYELNSNILQFTSSRCPPILNINVKDRLNCRAINNFIINKIIIELPDSVMLSAAWTSFATNYEIIKLEETIALLNKIGIKNIYVIGPTPEWNDRLPKILAMYYQKKLPHTIPERLNFGLRQNFIQTDEVMKKRIKNTKAIYISSKDILCDSGGCITKIDKSNDKITTFDYEHLTTPASEFLVSKFPSF